MKTLKEILVSKANKVLAEINGGIRKDGHHTIDLQGFTGADVEYYKGERQKGRYALVIRTHKANIEEVIIASMPCVDGSWGSGSYFPMGVYKAEDVFERYIDACQEYQGLYEIPC